ncbi:hypothetical protein Tco_0143792 [Tanacetum coccineum]
MGIMPTKTELALEQTQQGVSDEVLVDPMSMGSLTRVSGHRKAKHELTTQSGRHQNQMDLPRNIPIARLEVPSHEVFKLKNIKKDGYESFQDKERYEHVGPKVTSPQEGERLQDDKEIMFH